MRYLVYGIEVVLYCVAVVTIVGTVSTMADAYASARQDRKRTPGDSKEW